MELPWLILVLAAVPLAVLLLSRNKKKRGNNLPPGPVAVPVLGNLLWVRYKGIDLVRAIRRLHARYGPVVSLRVGSLLEVTISDGRLAHAALVGHGAALANRPVSASGHILGRDADTISTSSYGPRWRQLRRNFVAEVTQPARLRLFDPARAAAIAELTAKLREGGSIVDAFQLAVFRLLVAMCFGDERLDERTLRDIAAAQRDVLFYSATKRRVFAFLPAVTTRLFRGRIQTMLAMRRRLKNMYMPLIDARRDRNKNKPPLPHSYVDALLDIRLDDDGGRALTDDEMIAMCSEFLNAGTDTTATALQWIMAELVKNPAIQDKLHDEIKHTLAGSNRYHVSEEDVQRMPYLKAVVMEGLRRHPPGHMVLPHVAAEDMELGGYTIPGGTAVNFMVKDMAMDDRVWHRPEEFKPERFMPGGDAEGTDITGTREIRMMPFGAGRRICPGLNVGTLHLEYFVANLVRAYQWQAPDGEEVDVTSEKAEFTVVMANPLRARLVPRGA